MADQAVGKILLLVVFVTALMGAYSLYIYSVGWQFNTWFLAVLIAVGFYGGFGLLLRKEWGEEWALVYFALQTLNLEIDGLHYFIFSGVSWLWLIIDQPWRIQLNLFAVIMVILCVYRLKRRKPPVVQSLL